MKTTWKRVVNVFVCWTCPCTFVWYANASGRVCASVLVSWCASEYIFNRMPTPFKEEIVDFTRSLYCLIYFCLFVVVGYSAMCSACVAAREQRKHICTNGTHTGARTNTIKGNVLHSQKINTRVSKSKQRKMNFSKFVSIA